MCGVMYTADICGELWARVFALFAVHNPDSTTKYCPALPCAQPKT